ncbi:MAG: MBOAT family O-acyltransferase [Paracoccaceae bacterium]
MLFTSLEFLLFLPLTVALFWLLPARLRLPWLLLASLGFYASFGIGNLAYLAVVAAIALLTGRFLLSPAGPYRGITCVTGVSAVLAVLIVSKYYDPIAAEFPGLPTLGLTAPAGLSFYSFTAIALIVDRYRNPEPPRASAMQDVLYLAWFPKILAGPIERIQSFTNELHKKSTLGPARIALGCQLILWGLVKKVVVADNLAPFVDRTYAIPDYAVPIELIIATYFFAFQIYCDFSGYTDIARGGSQLFGIRLSENFRRAYFAQSIGEFWSRRWHISLSRWFRDYLYRPITGTNPSGLRMYFGLMVVFVVSGIWHAGLGYGIGIGFLAWGALNGVYICVERAFSPLRHRVRNWLAGSALGRIYGAVAALLVFHLVLVSWVFFRAGTMADAMTILARVWAALPQVPGLLLRYPFTAEHAFLAALIVALLAIEFVMEQRRLACRIARAPRAVRWIGWYACLFALILLGRWQGESFVYMQF